RVASGDAGAAGRDDDVDAGTGRPVGDDGRDVRRFVGDQPVVDNGMSRCREQLAGERSTAVGVGGPGVADGEDRAADGRPDGPLEIFDGHEIDYAEPGRLRV